LEKLRGLGTEKQARGKAIAAGQTGNIRACALMTRPAPPHMRQYSRMKPLDQRWNSSGLPLRGMPRMGLKWRACLRTMAPAANWKLRDACRESGIKHKRTRPCRLQANGKAERFIRTALKERAYAQACTRSRQGIGYLPIWTHRYAYHDRSRLLAEILQLYPRAQDEQRYVSRARKSPGISAR